MADARRRRRADGGRRRRDRTAFKCPSGLSTRAAPTAASATANCAKTSSNAPSTSRPTPPTCSRGSGGLSRRCRSRTKARRRRSKARPQQPVCGGWTRSCASIRPCGTGCELARSQRRPTIVPRPRSARRSSTARTRYLAVARNPRVGDPVAAWHPIFDADPEEIAATRAAVSRIRAGLLPRLSSLTCRARQTQPLGASRPAALEPAAQLGADCRRPSVRRAPRRTPGIGRRPRPAGSRHGRDAGRRLRRGPPCA